MGDFLLELCSEDTRKLADAADFLRFRTHLSLAAVDRPSFGLRVTFDEQGGLWAPYIAGDGSVFAVAGMLVLDEDDWRAAENVPGQGGLAGKALSLLYKAGGIDALERTDGNRVIVVHDAPAGTLHLVNDVSGVLPTFQTETPRGWAFGSHPDAVALVGGRSRAFDTVSQAEFLISSTVTAPFSFYEGVRSLEPGTSLSFSLDSGAQSRRVYFRYEFSGQPDKSEDDLADELAGALRSAVRRRTLARYGVAAIGLSGGLDSRLVLASLRDPTQAFAYCLFDRSNRELRTAQRLASAAGVRFLPIQRTPDYYAENAEEGIRISGGMGTFANNHFLGVVDRIRAEGGRTLLTGCYCDYLFKGLPLNRRASWVSGREHLAPFRQGFYFSRHMPDTALAREVQARWDSRFPLDLRSQDSPAGLFDLEVRRTFPLCYEGDNQQRLVPQRLTGWFIPVVDRGVLEVYRRIPSKMKLNRSVFLKASRRLLEGSRLLRIPDANTGAPLDASGLREAVSYQWLRVKRKAAALRPRLGSDGSWPDWQYYLGHSPRLAEMWRRPNEQAEELVRQTMGWKSMPNEASDFGDGRVFLFVSMLTMKLWLEQRVC